MNLPININDLLTARIVEWERLDMREFRFLSRRYRNRRVGEFLKELEMTEGRGTGIPKMLRAIQTNGSPAPVFHTDDDRTYFLVELSIHPFFAEALKQELVTQVTPQVGTKSALSRHQVEILHKCCENSTLIDLMAVVERSDRTKFRHQFLKPLLEAGLVEMTIPDKPTSSKQKYRLTIKGRQLLEQEKKR